jgi:hypothetical protein
MSNVVTKSKTSAPPLWAWFVAGVVGIGIGVGSAVAMSNGALGNSKFAVGFWSSDPLIGAKAANPWLRARISRVGLLALSKDETLYFDRSTDENGALLDEACSYKITGGILPARWWSVTIYDATQFLPRNSDSASSIDATRALTAGVSQWSGLIAPNAPKEPGQWLSSRSAGKFSLTLRLYNPTSIDTKELQKARFPKVTLIACDSATVEPPR